MKKYDRVLWDWNGTLLDDLNMNYEVMKVMLLKTGKAEFPSKEFYLEHFGFPIINFYKLLGFSFEKRSFEDVAEEYVEEYEKRLPGTGLFKNAESTVKTLFESGVKQAVISATGHDRLLTQVSRFGIKKYFDAVLGTENELGKGKTEVARAWLRKSGAEPRRTVFVGDTLHDLETARAIGCDCIFIARGHNSKERLLSSGCRVLSDIGEVLNEVL